MLQRTFAKPRPGVVADEKHGGEGTVQPCQGLEGVPGPAADEFCTLRQPVGNQVAGAVMRILDPDFLRTGSHGALAGCRHLGGHLLAGSLPGGLTQLGLAPIRDACHAFNICTDKNFH